LMRTVVFNVTKSGCTIEVALRPGNDSGEVVIALTDEVEILSPKSAPTLDGLKTQIDEIGKRAEFPPRTLTEKTIIQILHEHRGSVKIRQDDWNIYDEIAARLGVSIEARNRPTKGTGEAAWRPEVGYCRKNLEQSGIMQPTDVSGRGIWALKRNT